LFAGHHVADFFRGSLTFGPDNHILHDMHQVHWSIPYIPTVMMAIGFLIAWQFYIRRPDLPVALAQSQEPLYKFLLN
jgi:NADH-quinone oxidoreductase subunit L